MLIFEPEKYIKELTKQGINAADPYAIQKIKMYVNYLITNTKYRKNQIIKKVKNLGKDYFNGLSEEIVDNELNKIFNALKSKSENKFIPQSIKLYHSEMKLISELKEDKLMRLAFASLVIHKFLSSYLDGDEVKHHNSINVNKADIFRVAKLNNVSGTTKNKLLKKLCDKNFINFKVKTNNAFKFHSNWLAITLMTVPFNVDISETKDEIYEIVSNFDDVMLYLDLFLGKADIIRCIDCQTPIEKTSNAKQLCVSCAEKRKQISDKNRYRKNSENCN